MWGVGSQRVRRTHQIRTQTQQKPYLEQEGQGFQRVTHYHPDAESQNEKTYQTFHSGTPCLSELKPISEP